MIDDRSEVVLVIDPAGTTSLEAIQAFHFLVRKCWALVRVHVLLAPAEFYLIVQCAASRSASGSH